MTTPTVIRVSGTAVSLNPALSTPFAQEPECARTYRDALGTLLAWDVVYGQSFSTPARTCHPPEVTDWWFQSESTATYTGFGPTFECPEQYQAVQTAGVPGNDAEVQQVFCCPESFSLLAVQPLSNAFPSQCITTATSGQVLSFLDVQFPDGVQSSAMTTSTVSDDEVTIFGQPVNGFNFATATAGADEDGDNGGSTSLGVKVGVPVGVVGGLALIALGAGLLWRRRRRARATPAPGPEDSGALGPEPQDGGALGLGGKPKGLGEKPPPELSGDSSAELQGDGMRHELPGYPTRSSSAARSNRRLEV